MKKWARSVRERDMPEPVIITSDNQLKVLSEKLSVEPRIAVDTEANGFYAYQERVCLIQISSHRHDYIVDPLLIGKISILNDIFENPSIIKVFHAAENDIIALRRDLGCRVKNCFDTFLAAQLTDHPKVSLAGLYEEFFGIKHNKRMQRSDWGKRPLTPMQIKYAQMDSYYLLPLSYLMEDELFCKGLIHKAKKKFRAVENKEAVQKLFDENDYIKIKGSKKLSAKQKESLKKLYLFRNKEAKRLDKAPFRILNNQTMIKLSQSSPSSAADLSGYPGIPRYWKEDKLNALYECIEN